MPGKTRPLWIVPILHPGNHGEDPGPGPEAAHAGFLVLRLLNRERYSRTPLAWQPSLKDVGKAMVRQRPLLLKYHREDPGPGPEAVHAGFPVLRLDRERASWSLLVL